MCTIRIRVVGFVTRVLNKLQIKDMINQIGTDTELILCFSHVYLKLLYFQVNMQQ